MRIVFLGQAPFGADCLKALVEQGEEVVGAITVPDRPGKKPNPVKVYAEEKGIPLLQPTRLRNPEVYDWVKDLQPDLLVLAFVTDFVPVEVINLAKHGGINYHPSLLPKYRGGTAMNWAIINGEKETGVTIHYIDEGVDTGDIIIQEKVPIDPDDTVKSLYFEKLYPLGVKMVPEAVRLIREGKASRVPQDESQASFQPVIKEKDVIIDWNRPTQKVYDLIRGSNPVPGATTWYKGEKLKIWEGRPVEGAAGKSPGEVVALEDDGFIIATADGAIKAERVQLPESEKAKIPAADFIKAKSLQVGDRLGQ